MVISIIDYYTNEVSTNAKIKKRYSIFFGLIKITLGLAFFASFYLLINGYLIYFIIFLISYFTLAFIALYILIRCVIKKEYPSVMINKFQWSISELRKIQNEELKERAKKFGIESKDKLLILSNDIYLKAEDLKLPLLAFGAFILILFLPVWEIFIKNLYENFKSDLILNLKVTLVLIVLIIVISFIRHWIMKLSIEWFTAYQSYRELAKRVEEIALEQ
ncbi:MAG: hypothetical protein O9340_12025 [Cyclobacteriaceae bacterium]|nr:hypothetical protein [Cyclobacteriaceae bacterium]